MKKVILGSLAVLIAGFFGSLQAQDINTAEFNQAINSTAIESPVVPDSQSLQDEYAHPQYPTYVPVWRCDAWSASGPHNGGTFYWVAPNPYVARQRAVNLCNQYTGTYCYYSCYRLL